MTDTEREVLHEFYGPFDTTYFAIFSIVGDSYRLSFDSGPEYDVENILAEGNTAFKFPPNTLFELRVTVLYGRGFKFMGTQIPTFATTPTPRRLPTAAGRAPVPTCCSIFCDESIPCPDPLKSAMVCDGGNPRCVEAEDE